MVAAESVDERLTFARELADVGLDGGGDPIHRDEERELAVAERVEDLSVVATGPDVLPVGDDAQTRDVLTDAQERGDGPPDARERESGVEQRPHHPEDDEIAKRVRVRAVGGGGDQPAPLPVLELRARAARQPRRLRGSEAHRGLR